MVRWTLAALWPCRTKTGRVVGTATVARVTQRSEYQRSEYQLSDYRHLASGKVRELYEVDDELLLLVATDRISAYDWVLPTPIPDKGRILTAMSVFWFELL